MQDLVTSRSDVADCKQMNTPHGWLPLKMWKNNNKRLSLEHCGPDIEESFKSTKL